MGDTTIMLDVIFYVVRRYKEIENIVYMEAFSESTMFATGFFKHVSRCRQLKEKPATFFFTVFIIHLPPQPILLLLKGMEVSMSLVRMPLSWLF